MKIEGTYTASNFFVQQGMELDTELNRYRKFYKIIRLFKTYDAWKPIPKPDYLLLFKTLYAKCEACSSEDFENSSIIQLSLVYRKNRKLILHESKNMTEIKTLTHQLAKSLNLKIRDSATDRRNPMWLNATV